jgi:hypothetical protein
MASAVDAGRHGPIAAVSVYVIDPDGPRPIELRVPLPA